MGRAGTGVVEIAYVGVWTHDLDGWQELADTVLRTEVFRPGEGSLRLRMDERDYRVEVIAGQADGLAHIGFATHDEWALNEVAERLLDAGHKVIEESPDLAAVRRVFRLVSTVDPNGHRVEICCGPMTRSEDALAPRLPHRGFVTGEQGFGHVTMSVTNLPQSLGFYRDVLGMRLSDYILRKDTGRTLAFLRANSRHHSMAIWEVPDDPQPLKHLMLEVESIDDLGRGLDAATDVGVIAKGLGRHTNDGMLSFYARTPSGFEIEYGWGGRVVAENAPLITHELGSYWGHRPVH